MKKPLLLLAAALMSAAGVLAADLNPDQALTRLKASSPNQIASLSGGGASLRLQSTIGNLYVFSGEKGYVVLPSTDAAPALLAYSDSGEFEPEGNPGLAYWLEFYNGELKKLKASDAPPFPKRVKRTARAEIKPLTTTEWNQEAPYNELCPKVDGRETVTGCVATAMAQILKYHNYPEHGKGTHSYFWRPGEEELTFDYQNTTFEWNEMTDRYDSKSTPEARHAVAELMLACGVSVDMHYEPGESGAATTLMGESLINIFDYSPALWMPNRAFYGYDEWEGMIYADLEQGLPVLYSGAGTAGGHQFICDGYSSDGFFHFNWGWGGLSNGYFLLTALNPADLGVGGGAGGFNSSQIATLGVRPPQNADKPVYIFYNVEGFTSSATSVSAGDDFTCYGLYFNYSLWNMPDGSRLGMKFESEDHSVVKFMEGPGVGGFHPDDGRRDIQVKFPELPDGTYTIIPALHVDDKWEAVRMPVGYAAEVTAVVADNVAVITNQSAASVEVSEIELPSAVIYRDQKFPMPFSVTNVSSEEYYGSLTPVLLDADGNVAAESKFRPVDVLPEKSERIGDYIADFAAAKDQEFPAGDYKLLFRDEAGHFVSYPVDVTVKILTEPTEIKVSDFRLADAEPIAEPENTRFAFTLNCESGVFYDSLGLYIFPGRGGEDIYHKESESVYLIGGESKQLGITADLSRLADGEYLAVMYKGSESVTGELRFRIDRQTSAVGEIETDLPTAEYYDLSGVRHTVPLAPGIYIVHQGDIVKKIVIE